MGKLFKWVIRSLLALIVLIALVLVVLTTFKIPVDLTRFKGSVQEMASEALKRPVTIEGSIVLSTSLNPYFTMEGLVIENPEGFATDTFLKMKLARIQVELLPLLERKVHITEVKVNNLTVNLEETDSGKVNWVLDSTTGSSASKPVREPEQQSGQSRSGVELAGDILVVKHLELQNILVDFHRPEQSEPAHFALTSCVGSMATGKPLILDIKGNVLNHSYTVDLSIGSVEELVLYNRSWMDIKANIAETDLSFSGNVDLATAAKALTLQTMVSGESLSSLNDLLRLDLPPFAKYKLKTTLHLKAGTADLEKLVVQTGTSSLEGNAKIINDDERLTLNIGLHSPLIQINDFVFENWSWNKETDQVQARETKEEQPSTSLPGNKRITDPQILEKLQASLVISADKVLSGEDELGNGRLEASVENGLIEIDPFMVEVPGGKVELSASLKPGKVRSNAELKVKMENFDIGIMARRKDPDSNMGGQVNLDINLDSSASSIPELLANGNGYFDFSGDLENFSAGIIDLWAVNLVAAIVSNADKDKSELNCAVGRWSVTDGLLRPDVFVIDTSKIRICAEGEVDLGQQKIDLVVKPVAKKPEFFSLATPLEVHGTFSDIGFGLGGGGIVGTAVKFIASPVSVPIRRTFSTQPPEDGSDICGMALGRENRENLVVPMCKN